MNASCPIGVFDSGVGGLTVVEALARHFPRESILYVADQAHVPYGGRPLTEIREFAGAISEFLAKQNCKLIIMACNISSASALEETASALAPLPVLGVINGAAVKAAHSADVPRIGVLATRGTVDSGAYTRSIKSINPKAIVVEIACPRFVPLVESNRIETPDAYNAALEYMEPLSHLGCTQIILGCTHYPFLMPTLQKAAARLYAEMPSFLNPADEMASILHSLSTVLWNDSNNASHHLLTTGDVDSFIVQSQQFLPDLAASVGGAVWRNGHIVMKATE